MFDSKGSFCHVQGEVAGLIVVGVDVEKAGIVATCLVDCGGVTSGGGGTVKGRGTRKVLYPSV